MISPVQAPSLPQSGMAPRPRVLVLGHAADEARRLADLLPSLELVPVAAAEAFQLLAAGSATVLSLGPAFGGRAAAAFLERALEDSLLGGVATVVLASGADTARLQNLIDRDALFFTTRRPPLLPETAELLAGAAARARANSVADEVEAALPDSNLPWRLRLLERMLTTPDLGAVSQILAEAVETEVTADRYGCIIHEPDRHVIWSVEKDGTHREDSAASGLVGYVCAAGQPVRLSAAHEDPRWDPETEVVGANLPGARFLAVPVREPSLTDDASPPTVLAALVAERNAVGDPFTAQDELRLTHLAELAAPTLHLLTAMERQRNEDPLFRREAIDHNRQRADPLGRPLRVGPAWHDGIAVAIGITMTALLLFLSLGSVPQYASGQAVLELDHHVEVTSAAGGLVAEVHHAPGSRVAPGQTLVSLDAQEASAQLEKVKREFDAALIERLRDPGAASTGAPLSGLLEERRLATSNLDARQVRSPAGGVISQIRVQAGQMLAPGEVVATLSREGHGETAGRLVAVLPGEHRPLLEPGMTLQFELEGHPTQRHELKIARVAEGVVGPQEARRILGPVAAGALSIEGSVVFVEADLDRAFFESEGERLDYHDGMLGRAEVKVRSDRILVALFPGLEGVLSR